MFWKYFYDNFHSLGLKKLVATYYDIDTTVYKTTYDGNDIVKSTLQCNGDFRSQECIDILNECDIVVTNPPFSLFREFVATLMGHEKRFLIIGNKNAINYNDFFHCIKENKLWFGFSSPSDFNTEDGITKKMNGLCRWFTNLDIEKRHIDLVLTQCYDEAKYPMYENYRAINVNKVQDIPYDYYGIMGVPITFFDKYNPEQFEILGRSGDIEYAKTECDFFTPPSKEKQMDYKKRYKTWRVQNSYLIESDGTIKFIYYRVFVRRKPSHI